MFLWCDCGYYDRIGIPCSDTFFVVDEMLLRVFHIRHLKMFLVHYGDGSRLSDLMMQAQVGFECCYIIYVIVLGLGTDY